jgi:oligopeptide/dipeptide ABC transporter ATP-binding protein
VSLLQVNDLTKRFQFGALSLGRRRASVQAIRGVSFTIEKGETLGLVGESGCGKSTLGRCILRLVEPTTGQIVFEDRDLLSLSDKEMRQIRRHMQIVFQDPYSSLDPRQRVGTTILEGLSIHRLLKPSEREGRLVELLENVGLKPEHANSYPHEFSGGQRQRIAIARALAVNPIFLVADEAVSALDVSIQAQILNLFLELQKKMNLTYLFISHNLHVVRHISDRIAVMYLGRLVEVGETEEICANPRHPYTKALLSAALEPDPKRRSARHALSGDVTGSIDPPVGCAFHPRCPLAEDICRVSDPYLAFSGTHGIACHKVTLGSPQKQGKALEMPSPNNAGE